MFRWPAGGAELFGWYLGMWLEDSGSCHKCCLLLYFYQSSTTPVSVAAILHGSCNVTETRCRRDGCAAAGCAISAAADVTSTVWFGLFFFFFFTKHSFLGGILKWSLQWTNNHPVKVKDDSNLTWEMETNQIRNSNFTFALGLWLSPNPSHDLFSSFHLPSFFHSTIIFPFGLLVSFAPGDANELLNAPSVPQGLSVLHVLSDDLMQSAADSCDGVIWHGLSQQAVGIASSPTAAIVVVAASRQTVHQVPHGIFTWRGGLRVTMAEFRLDWSKGIEGWKVEEPRPPAGDYTTWR